MTKNIIAIVPAAGLGKRFSASIKKTFADLDNIPLLIHTLIRLSSEKLITDIIPALREDDIENGFQLINKHGVKKITKIAPGGKERQDSIYNALKLLERSAIDPEDIILIHDGARPFIPDGLVPSLISELKNFDGVIPATPVKETLKEVSAEGVIISTIDRDKFRSVQTPQAFTFRVIKKAYDHAYAKGLYATDDAALVENIGGRVKIIPGSPYNIKVTTPEDLEMLDWILKRENLKL